MNNSQIQSKGFTLVELAIVIVIIGLLVGGVLQGQELIKQAKIRKLTSDVTSYSSAVLMFKDKYKFLPGDMPTARAVAMLGATNGGNGDGRIWDWPTFSEIMLGWQHLALAKLIKGSYSGIAADWQNSTPPTGFDETYYSFWEENSPFLSTNNRIAEATLSFGKRAINSEISNPALTALDAFLIDTKMDDGNPNSGIVYYWLYPAHRNYKANCVTAGAYVTTSSDLQCSLYFILLK